MAASSFNGEEETRERNSEASSTSASEITLSPAPEKNAAAFALPAAGVASPCDAASSALSGWAEARASFRASFICETRDFVALLLFLDAFG